MACAWGIVRNIIVIAQADILDVKLGESIGLEYVTVGVSP